MQFIHSYDKISDVEETHAGVSEWQTRQTQNLLWATTCGFKSRCRQYKIYAEALVKSRASAFFAFHGSNYFQSSPDASLKIFSFTLTANSILSHLTIHLFVILLPDILPNIFLFHTFLWLPSPLHSGNATLLLTHLLYLFYLQDSGK